MSVSSVVVVGAGVTGLAAAARAIEHGCTVDILEATAHVGGKLASQKLDGITLDAGAESVLARRREGIDAMTAAGLGNDIEHPARKGASLWLDDMVPLPTHQLVGIPTRVDEEEFATVLTPEGLQRLRHEPNARALDSDLSVGAFVERQLGREVVDRLVEPILGGVYAGRADEISVDASLPGVRERVAERGSLLTVAAELVTDSTAPVFATVVGGLGRFADVWAKALISDALVRLHYDTDVVGIDEETGPRSSWRVTTDTGESFAADAVVLATPAFATARILKTLDSAQGAAQVAADVQYASVALVTTVFESDDVTQLPAGTGFLVPPVTGRITKAATFVSRKWGWVQEAAPGREVLRFSVGRFGDIAPLTMNDDELTTAVLGEVSSVLGIQGAPRAASVTRWNDSLPQYRPGHLEALARLRTGLPGGVEVSGAAWDGVGIAACIASGRDAVDRLVSGPS